MQHLIEQIQANWGLIVTILFVLSEGLALIPSIKANSVFQMIAGLIVKEHDKLPKA